MIYLDIHYEMRRHGLKGQQLAVVLRPPLSNVTFKLYGETELSLHKTRQLANLFGCSLDYLAGHRVVTRTYSPGEGIGGIIREQQRRP